MCLSWHGSPLPKPTSLRGGHVVGAAIRASWSYCGWGGGKGGPKILFSGVCGGDRQDISPTCTRTTSRLPDFLFSARTAGATKPSRLRAEGRRRCRRFSRPSARNRLPARPHAASYHPDGIKVEVTSPVTPRAVNSRRRRHEHRELRVNTSRLSRHRYRMRFEGRSVVMSGDSIFCESLLPLARGPTDGLRSHDTCSCWKCAATPPDHGAGAHGIAFGESQLHIPTDEVAKLAKSAGVGKLVLLHLIPPIPIDGGGCRRSTQGMAEQYGGPDHVAPPIKNASPSGSGPTA